MAAAAPAAAAGAAAAASASAAASAAAAAAAAAAGAAAFAPPPLAVRAAAGRRGGRRAGAATARRRGGRRGAPPLAAAGGRGAPVPAAVGGGAPPGGGGGEPTPPRAAAASGPPVARRAVLAAATSAAAAAAASAAAAAAAAVAAGVSPAAAATAAAPPFGGGDATGGAAGILARLPRPPRPPSGLGRAATAAVLADAAWPAAFPYADADWARVDETPDAAFYAFPRFVYHLDAAAVAAQAAYFARLTARRPDGRLPDVLDLCASWVSFLPPAYTAAAEAASAAAAEAGGAAAGGGGGGPGEAAAAAARRRPRVAGVGLNKAELAANPQLSTYAVLDLNGGPAVPRLPYPDATFDVAVCAVSIDYLTRPLGVAAELARVLRPGGVVAATFSNRSFGTKAVAAWSAGGDADHVYLVGAVLHYAGGGGMFDQLRAVDLSPPGGGDPLYAVEARRV